MCHRNGLYIYTGKTDCRRHKSKELDPSLLSVIAQSETPAYEWWHVATVTSEPFVNLKTMETRSYNTISISGTEQRP